MKARVFVLELPYRSAIEQRGQMLRLWEDTIKETEIEGSILLVLDNGAKLSELTGKGLEKLTIEDGRIVFPKEQ